MKTPKVSNTPKTITITTTTYDMLQALKGAHIEQTGEVMTDDLAVYFMMMYLSMNAQHHEASHEATVNIAGMLMMLKKHRDGIEDRYHAEGKPLPDVEIDDDLQRVMDKQPKDGNPDSFLTWLLTSLEELTDEDEEE